MNATSRRAGFLLHEAMMAVALALAGTLGVTQLLGMVAQQRRVGQQEAAAAFEAGNLMEDLAARPWDEVTPQLAASLSLSESCRRILPEGKLQVEVVAEDPGAKRIAVRIDWRTASGGRSAPVALTSWRFREEGRP